MDKVKEIQKINGVLIQSLKKIEDNRGSVLHMIRNDGVLFEKFGEVYFSEIYPGKVKAWKRHREQTQHLAGLGVPAGGVLRVDEVPVDDDLEGAVVTGD